MQLGTGFKEQIASDLASQYSSAYSQLRQEESSKLGKLQTSYLQTLAQQEKALAEQGERFAEIESALYDYMGITDTSLLEQAYGADGGLGFFEMTEPGSYKITERGIDAFDKALNDYYNATEKDRGQLFTDYLAEQNPELLDWYKQNSGLVRELVGGLKAGDVSYSKEERAYDIEINDLLNNNNRKFINTELSKYDFTSNEEKLNTTKKLLSLKPEVDDVVNKQIPAMLKTLEERLNESDIRYKKTEALKKEMRDVLNEKIPELSDYKNYEEYSKAISEYQLRLFKATYNEQRDNLKNKYVSDGVKYKQLKV